RHRSLARWRRRGRASGVVRTPQRHVYACKARDRGNARRPERRGKISPLRGRLRYMGLHLCSLARALTAPMARTHRKGCRVTDRNANRMWGGRFAMSPAEVMQEINASIGFDKALAPQDIRASKAHASMLAAQGIITKEDARKITAGLDRVLEEIQAGRFRFSQALEDVHMHVESRLEELIGEPGRRL